MDFIVRGEFAARREFVVCGEFDHVPFKSFLFINADEVVIAGDFLHAFFHAIDIRNRGFFINPGVFELP